MGNTGTTVNSIISILEKYGRNPNKLIPILQDVQAEYLYLPEDIMSLIAAELGIAPSTV